MYNPVFSVDPFSYLKKLDSPMRFHDEQGRYWLVDSYEYSVSVVEYVYDLSSNTTGSVEHHNPGHVYENKYTLFVFLNVSEIEQLRSTTSMTVQGLSLLVLPFLFIVNLMLANFFVSPAVKAWEKQQRFIIDASHEIKTPLSIISANLEVLQANQDMTVASQQAWLDSISVGTGRLSKINDNLLESLRIERGKPLSDKSIINISKLLNALVDEYTIISLTKQIVISKDIEPDRFIMTDPIWLEKALLAVLDNATKYTELGGQITVSLIANERTILIEISNSGPGIAGHDLPYIFDPFYRSDDTRTDSDSHGLGLSIAKQAVEQLGGSISATSTPGQQTTFQITLGG
jgi:signal transduction histidine kinase